MKTLALILTGLGVLAILIAGACVVILFELDFMVEGVLPWLLIGIIGGVVVGVALISVGALVSPRSVQVSFPMFRSSGAGTEQDPTLEEKQ